MGQGDTSLIIRPFNQCTIVIDAFNTVEDYLINHNIKEIDYLIITHGDYDHYQKADWILSNLIVKQIVLSEFDDSDFKIAHQNSHLTLLVESGDTLVCGDISLNILAPIAKASSVNNASIVFQTKIDDLTYLFTGDIEAESEQLLVNKYKHSLKSDVLKVPHHGSKTSSTQTFIDFVNPKHVVISAGHQNKFSHPDKNVLNRYESKDALSISQQLIRQFVLNMIGLIVKHE